MLRQVYIFHNQKLAFSHSFAIALGSEELKNVIEVIESYLIMPMPGKTFHRPMANLQIFHRGVGTTYFLLVTDLVDTIEYIDRILKNIIAKFKEVFPEADAIKVESAFRDEFIDYLAEMQKDLRSKIAIIGPYNSGKTTFYNLIKNGEERSIMNFAKVAPVEIGNLSFEIWDFQLDDNFSLLWSKFVGGSDLVILLFAADKYNVAQIDHFLTLQKKDAKFSRLIVVANKTDLISEEQFKAIQNAVKENEVKKLSLIGKNNVSAIEKIISEGLNLKKGLPEEFNSLLNNAEIFEKEKKYDNAINTYQQLLDLVQEYQEFSYLKELYDKIEELKEEKAQYEELKNKRERKSKFSAPRQIKFEKKVSVKTLPTGGTIFKSAQKKPQINKQNLNQVKPNAVKSSKPRLRLRPEDVKISLKAIKSKEKAIQPKKYIPHERNLTDEIVENEDFDFARELQKLILKNNANLNISLCEKFVEEMLKTLQKPLKYEDLEVAAKYFCELEMTI
ncbi:MAG: hypothetical protein GF383_06090 [Candidatus Lokiarchaeota archaeon]|nr:hypothetical protein [Candidatus Lokiarchaeota archaeon]MBD3339516.1 hypothetical protein [Candidatus Lokiarchaeota archaeon]